MRVPSRRSWSLVAQASPFQPFVSGGMLVAMWTTPLQPLLPPLTDTGSNRSTVDGLGPLGGSWSAFASDRAAPFHLVTGGDQPRDRGAYPARPWHLQRTPSCPAPSSYVDSWIHSAPRTSCSVGTVAKSSVTMSPTVTAASSARQASSARHITRAMPHGRR